MCEQEKELLLSGGRYMSRVSIQIRVPFSDVDNSGRIHFTAMFRYVDIAEHELVRAIGYPYATTLQDIAFPRVRVACDYLGAICYDDRLTIEARVQRVGRSSWTVAFSAYVIERAGKEVSGEEIAARGEMTIVTMNPQTERARSLPDDFRAALLAD